MWSTMTNNLYLNYGLNGIKRSPNDQQVTNRPLDLSVLILPVCNLYKCELTKQSTVGQNVRLKKIFLINIWARRCQAPPPSPFPKIGQTQAIPARPLGKSGAKNLPPTADAINGIQKPPPQAQTASLLLNADKKQKNIRIYNII